MHRDFLVLTVCLLIAIVIVIITQTVIVTNLISVQPSRSVSAQPPVGTLISVHLGTIRPAVTGWAKIWEEYGKPSIAAFGAICAAVIAGVVGYRSIMRQLKTTTRNAFLDMLVSTPAYKSDIDSFLSALYNKNFKDLKERTGSQALFYLFLLKPEIKKDLIDAINSNSRRGLNCLIFNGLFFELS